MSDFKTALEQKKYRKDNSNVTTFNTDLDDSTIGEGTAGLVKRKEMLNTIADMQEKGTLRYTDNGYYIKGDANNVSRSDLFKNTLSTVVNYNATIAEQKREKKREEEKDNREAQAQVIVDPNNTGTALVPKKTAYPGDPFAQLMDYYDTSDTNTKMHLLATGIDAATIPLGMVPGLTIASAIAGAGATTLHGIADWNSGDKWGAVKGMAMGYSLDALSVFGGKGLKAMNSIGKIGGWIKGAVPILKAGLVGGGMYAGLDAASKVKYEDILNRDISSWDTTDYANIVSLVQFISSGAKGASRGIVNTVSKGNKGFTKILGGGLEVDRNIIGKGKAKGAQMAEKLTGKFANTEEAYFDKFDHVMSRVTGRASNLDIKKGRKMSIDADEAYNKAKLNRKNAFNNLSKAQELNRKNSKGSSNWEGPFSEVRNARKVDNSSFDAGGNGQPRLAPRLLPVKYTGIAPRLLPVKYTGIAPVKQSGIASQLPVKYTGPKMGQGEFTKKFKNTDKFKREELNKGGEDIKKVQNEIDKYDKELNEAEIQRDKANKNKNDLDSNEEHFEAEKYGTVEKLESEINITKRNYENELNILDTKKKRLARRIRKDPSSVKGKKKVKEVQDEIKKLKKEMDKDISGKQGKIDTEKKSKKRFYRKPRNIIKKIHHAAIDKTNDLLGKLSMGDSDYRFLKEWMRKDPELFNKAAEGDKEATKEILSAAQRHLKIQREKLEASKAKIKREKKSGSRRLGGKLVPKYNRGGRFIRKF
ncbi:MAG: hypothetical protein KAH32_04805, partial [Chlamydiia bacterium]|nr:hypothetical protein [Chlamydiia bacterium]